MNYSIDFIYYSYYFYIADLKFLFNIDTYYDLNLSLR